MPQTPSGNPVSSEKDPQKSGKPAREVIIVMMAWLAVSFILTTIALPNLSSPGLYYDEAVFAGMAKDFVLGKVHGEHMPGSQTVNLFGRPFPLFVQTYLGAVKTWLIIPSFMVFGANIPLLRLTALFWGLISLLLFMLWTRELLGLPASLIAAPVLGLDPSFFFMTVLDWGSVIPSLLCRFGGYYLFILWWRNRKMRYGFFAAFLFGLGFLNKVDFVVILLGAGTAVSIAYWKEVTAAVRKARGKWAFCILGLLLGAGPMALKIWSNVQGILTERVSAGEHELLEKFNTACAMYDGSYFYRLMDVGGTFETMYKSPSAVWSPFGVVFLCSFIYLAVGIIRSHGTIAQRRRVAFMLLSAVIITIGVFLYPFGLRVHHSTLAYPFPHLIITTALTMLWQQTPVHSIARWSFRTIAAGVVITVIFANFAIIQKIQTLVEETGGRGRWSNAISTFCDEVKGRTEFSIISLDWGFNEQLDFLADGTQVVEPIWDLRSRNRPSFSITPNTIFLAHPREYSLTQQDVEFFNQVSQEDTRNVSIKPYRDRQGRVAFYAIRFLR